jgi:hypothetical protein
MVLSAATNILSFIATQCVKVTNDFEFKNDGHAGVLVSPLRLLKS